MSGGTSQRNGGASWDRLAPGPLQVSLSLSLSLKNLKLEWVDSEWSPGPGPRLSVWCIEVLNGPAKKEAGWIAPRFRLNLKDHETLLTSVRWVGDGTVRYSVHTGTYRLLVKE
jgi:hypothetical protein